MSKKINVNPDHYKVAGRERQGEDIVQGLERQAYGQQQAHEARWQARQQEAVASPPPEPEKAMPIRVEREPLKKAARAAASRKKGKARAKSARGAKKPAAGKRKRPVGKARATTRRKTTGRKKS